MGLYILQHEKKNNIRTSPFIISTVRPAMKWLPTIIKVIHAGRKRTLFLILQQADIFQWDNLPCSFPEVPLKKWLASVRRNYIERVQGNYRVFCTWGRSFWYLFTAHWHKNKFCILRVIIWEALYKAFEKSENACLSLDQNVKTNHLLWRTNLV